jgi:hypothetical protein
MTARNGVPSPAAKKLDEAIERAIEGRPIVPERAAFIDAGTEYTEREMRRAAENGNAAVLVFADGSVQVIPPEEISGRKTIA